MFAVIIERKNYISFVSMNDVLVCILYSREFKMKKGVLEKNSAQSDEKTTLFKV